MENLCTCCGSPLPPFPPACDWCGEYVCDDCAGYHEKSGERVCPYCSYEDLERVLVKLDTVDY